MSVKNIRLLNVIVEIATHKALCADIEKGRRVEEAEEISRVLGELFKVEEGYSRNLEKGCRVWKEKHDILKDLLDTAVRLLGETRRCCGTIFDATFGQYKQYDDFCDERDNLLAKIIAVQKDGGKG